MRITGGRARSIRLTSCSYDGLRPASDGLREALFSSLGPWVQGKCFIDFFAGTGAYGLEAISRGAASGLFVEQNSKGIAVIEENLQKVCRSMDVDITPFSLIRQTIRPTNEPSLSKADLVLMDPPYQFFRDNWAFCLGLARKHLRPGPGSRFVFECPGDMAEFDIPGFISLKLLGKKKQNQPAVRICRLAF